jgi:hypothetical protein
MRFTSAIVISPLRTIFRCLDLQPALTQIGPRAAAIQFNPQSRSTKLTTQRQRQIFPDFPTVKHLI